MPNSFASNTCGARIYFAPIVTSSVAIGLVFRMLYNSEYGLLNTVIAAFGGMPVDWLGSQGLAKVAVMGVVIWRWTGLLAIYFLAGLQGIPHELYEAAAIDGANGLQRFFSVTLPALRPVTLFVSIIVLIGSLQIFDDPANSLWQRLAGRTRQRRSEHRPVSLRTRHRPAALRLCFSRRVVPLRDYLRPVAGSVPGLPGIRE